MSAPLILASSVAAALGLAVLGKRKPASTGAQSTGLAPTPTAPNAGAQRLPAPAPSSLVATVGGALVPKVAAGAAGLGGAAATGGLIAAAAVIAEGAGRVVEKVTGSENAGNVARAGIIIPGALGMGGLVGVPAAILAAQGAKKLSSEVTTALKVESETAQKVNAIVGRAAGVGVAYGAAVGPLGLVVGAGAQLAAEAGSAAIGAVAGRQTEKNVRAAVSQLDPMKTGTVPNKVLSSVGGAIGGVFAGIGGIFGKK